jgi:hypothetical protein
MQGVAEPVVASLDKNGCIMHHLYREATRYINGKHVKDLSMLNRNVSRIVVIDDDALECQLHPGNLLKIKSYDDPTDREDRVLLDMIPLLIEIAKEVSFEFEFDHGFEMACFGPSLNNPLAQKDAPARTYVGVTVNPVIRPFFVFSHPPPPKKKLTDSSLTHP